MIFVAWGVIIAIFMALAAVAGWIMTKMKGGRAPMDSIGHETTRDRFWKSPF